MDTVTSISLILSIIVITSVSNVDGVCGHGCVVFRTRIPGEIVPDMALFNHVFKTLTNLTEWQQCFVACTQDCRCMSYNFQTQPSSDGTRLCELNSNDYNADSLDAMKSRPGFKYFDISLTFSSKQDDPQCEKQACSNGCCQPSPCQNGGKCQGLCGQKQRLQCICTAGSVGKLCSEKIKSCLDYLRYNRSSAPGIYDIQDGGGTIFKVFCDFDLTNQTAWTLVMSYSLANHAAQFKGRAFYVDHPVKEAEPNWDAHRMSKARMLWVQSQSSQWRATCNYNTYGVDFTDYVRSTFDNLDPMTFNNAECKKITYVNIRGSYCSDCTIWVHQDDRKDFVFNGWWGQYGASPKCQFVVASGVTSSESFGLYDFVDTAHRCSKGQDSTTQYWFGASLDAY